MDKEDKIRESILEAAETLFQRWGIHKTTMEDIAREAGKGKSSIYYYFKSKEAMLEAVAMRQAERITLAVQKEVAAKTTAREQLLAYVTTSFRETRQAVTLFAIARGEIRANQQLIRGVVDQYYARHAEFVGKILRAGIERHEFHSIGIGDLPAATRAIVTVVRSLILDLFIASDDTASIDLIIELLSGGL